jgi:hypothetical protein
VRDLSMVPNFHAKVCYNCNEDVEKEDKGCDAAYFSDNATKDNCRIVTYSNS